MKHILLVGAGNLGSRHLQAIAQWPSPICVSVVEPSLKAREVAKQRWDDIASSKSHTLSFVDIEQISTQVDFAVIATLAIGRLTVLKALFALQVPVILCEKVAFQSIEHYQMALHMAKQTNTQIYLNYIYRLSASIQKLRALLDGQSVNISVSAGNVELGCNLIHHLDLATYFNHEAKLQNLTISSLEIDSVNRRHPSLKSFYGLAHAHYSNGATLEARLLNDPSKDCEITISTQQQSFVLNETTGQLSGSGFINEPFIAPRVSDTTTDIMAQIIDQNCVLPTLSQSFADNQMMLKCLNLGLGNSDADNVICPIT